MELYNSLIKESNSLLDKGSPRAWEYRPGDAWKDIGSSELVLQKDAAYELGAMGKGSANYVLFTSSPELVDKDQILLYGADLGEIKGEVDLARIFFLRVGLIDVDYEAFYRTRKYI